MAQGKIYIFLTLVMILQVGSSCIPSQEHYMRCNWFLRNQWQDLYKLSLFRNPPLPLVYLFEPIRSKPMNGSSHCWTSYPNLAFSETWVIRLEGRNFFRSSRFQEHKDTPVVYKRHSVASIPRWFSLLCIYIYCTPRLCSWLWSFFSPVDVM